MDQACFYYIYILSSLKDGYMNNRRYIPIVDTVSYRPLIESFIINLSRDSTKMTYRDSIEKALPHKFRVLEGIAGEPAQARVIVQCADGWEPDRFEAIAVRQWNKMPVTDTLFFHHVVCSFGMNLDFLSADWGRQSGCDAPKQGQGSP